MSSYDLSAEPASSIHTRSVAGRRAWTAPEATNHRSHPEVRPTAPTLDAPVHRPRVDVPIPGTPTHALPQGAIPRIRMTRSPSWDRTGWWATDRRARCRLRLRPLGFAHESPAAAAGSRRAPRTSLPAQRPTPAAANRSPARTEPPTTLHLPTAGAGHRSCRTPVAQWNRRVSIRTSRGLLVLEPRLDASHRPARIHRRRSQQQRTEPDHDRPDTDSQDEYEHVSHSLHLLADRRPKRREGMTTESGAGQSIPSSAANSRAVYPSRPTSECTHGHTGSSIPGRPSRTSAARIAATAHSVGTVRPGSHNIDHRFCPTYHADRTEPLSGPSPDTSFIIDTPPIDGPLWS